MTYVIVAIAIAALLLGSILHAFQAHHNRDLHVYQLSAARAAPQPGCTTVGCADMWRSILPELLVVDTDPDVTFHLRHARAAAAVAGRMGVHEADASAHLDESASASQQNISRIHAKRQDAVALDQPPPPPSPPSPPAPLCADAGPWPCLEPGCPARSVGCANMSEMCSQRFGGVLQHPPPNTSKRWVSDLCPVTCDACPEEDEEMPAGEDEEEEAGEEQEEAAAAAPGPDKRCRRGAKECGHGPWGSVWARDRPVGENLA
jgi:hypothetical protein